MRYFKEHNVSETGSLSALVEKYIAAVLKDIICFLCVRTPNQISSIRIWERYYYHAATDI
jgi:hypothetical protein